MKLSASVTMMFREVDMPARFAALAASGFTGAEIQFLAEGDPHELAAAARAAGVRIALINVPMGDFLMGGNGLSGVPGREAEFRAAFQTACMAADVLSAEAIHIGASRVPGGVDRAQCLDTLRANLDWASAQDRPDGTRLLIEPMNAVDAPDVLLRTQEDGAAIVRESGGRLWLQFDIYHCALSGEDPVTAFHRNQDIIRHVQFSDAPGRQAPGLGTLPFPAIIRAIREAGYDGWWGAEYVPVGRTQESLGWLPMVREAA